MNNSALVDNSNGSCFYLEEVPQEVISKIAKWISLVEGLGIVILNSLLILLIVRLKKRSRMAFFVQQLAIAGIIIFPTYSITLCSILTEAKHDENTGTGDVKKLPSLGKLTKNSEKGTGNVDDLSVGLFYVLPEAIFDRFMNNWEKFSCQILYGYCANLTIYASTFLIVVLTIDRLFVIMKPLSSSTTGRKYRYSLISGAWLLAIALAIPYGLNVKFFCTTQGNLCFHHFEYQEAVVLAELIINVIIPVVIIAFCYTWIIYIILRRERAGFGCATKKIRFSNGSRALSGTFENIDTSRSKVINNAKKKTIKILLVVVIVYILSWTPLNVAQVLNVFEILDAGNVYILLHALSPINSLMNPLVFLCFNQQMFRTDKNKQTGYTMTSHTDCERV